jgi:hypothetical protein
MLSDNERRAVYEDLMGLDILESEKVDGSVRFSCIHQNRFGMTMMKPAPKLTDLNLAWEWAVKWRSESTCHSFIPTARSMDFVYEFAELAHEHHDGTPEGAACAIWRCLLKAKGINH